MKTLPLLLCAAALALAPAGRACTRAVYLGPDGMTATGRTMDWREDPQTNLYIFPRGMARRGARTDNTVFWTSKYGSLSAAGYDIGITEGMNERGLVANLLFLTETVYDRPGDTRPVMGLSIWTQYVLDNFATVAEAVAELSKERFRIDAPDLPNGVESRLHLAISDPSGDSAIFEYIDGRLTIHHGRQYQVLTNSPTYDKQLAVNDYWQSIGGLVMLPGTNRSSDRFVRASFYIDAVVQSSDPRVAVPTVMSVMRNVSVPYGISTPDKPYIASTRWRSVADQKNRVYWFEPTLGMETFRIDLSAVDFAPGSGERVLRLTGGERYTGDATDSFRPLVKPFQFLFGE
ncbi:linear amide C-N hydrolase [Alistipes sp.]|uniref:linear amide C-N hydrolase n=1 Tax=Alistipes sp. TaxID=1872444 RepID=UPI003AF108B3